MVPSVLNDIPFSQVMQNKTFLIASEMLLHDVATAIWYIVAFFSSRKKRNNHFSELTRLAYQN